MSEDQLREQYFEYWAQQQRNGHWSSSANGNGNNLYSSNSNGISPTGSGASGTHQHANGDVNAGSGSGSSQRGSQSALLSGVKKERHKWPKGKDFLFSTWAFV